MVSSHFCSLKEIYPNPSIDTLCAMYISKSFKKCTLLCCQFSSVSHSWGTHFTSLLRVAILKEFQWVFFFCYWQNKKIVIEIFKLSLARNTFISMNPHHLRTISSILRTIIISSFTLHLRTSALKDQWIWNL